MLDYEMAREDERSFNSIQAAMFGVAVALVAGLSALLTRACAFQGSDAAAGDTCTYVPEGVLVLTPLAPFALVTFVLLLGLVATVRSYYLRALEAELQTYAGRPLKGLAPIRAGAYTELMSEMVSLRRGERGYPFLVLLIVVAALFIFGGFIVYIYSGVEALARVAILLLYGPATLFVLVQAAQGTIGGRGLFNHLAASYVTRLRQGEGSTVPLRPGARKTSTPAVRERRLGSYLILPRPEELPKAFFAPLVFAIACLSLDGFSADLVVPALVVWFALEYLIYEARYQWNDIRGLHEDFLHRDRSSRGRLPLGSDPPASTISNLRLSLLVAALRLALVPAIALAVGRGTIGPVMLLMAAVFAVAVPYELLRSAADDECLPERRRRRFARAIWAMVGGGYLIRGVAGMCLAGYALGDPVTIAAAIAFAAYGVMFVTMTWALEAVAHSVRDGDGALEDRPGSRQRLHVKMLRDFMDLPSAGEEDLMFEKGLSRNGAFLAPWNVSFFVCAAFGGIVGVGLAAAGQMDGVALAGGVGALAGALAMAGWEGKPRLLAFAAVTASLLALGWGAGDGAASLLAVAPWLFFAGLYLSFRDQSYYSLKRWLPDVPAAARKVTRRLLIAIVGRRSVGSLRKLAEESRSG